MKKPYYDHYKLGTVYRAIELQFGLAIDRGADKTDRNKKPGAKVQTFESQTGQESFVSYVARHKEQIMTGLAGATDWQELHKTFLTYGLVLKISGNGLAIANRYALGKHSTKASGLDRSLSKDKLEAILGQFKEPEPDLFKTQPDENYTAIPLHLGPNRDNLYTIFQTEMARRKTILGKIQADTKAHISLTQEMFK